MEPSLGPTNAPWDPALRGRSLIVGAEAVTVPKCWAHNLLLMLSGAVLDVASRPVLLILAGALLWTRFELGTNGVLLLIAIGVTLPIVAHAVTASLKRVDPITLRIGVDGMFISGAQKSSRVRREFISYQDIESVSSNDSVVTLQVRGSDNPIRLRPLGSAARKTEVAYALAARVQAAKELTSSRFDPDVEHLLARGERPTLHWLSDLRNVAVGTNYRAVAIRYEDLWSVVEGPSRSEIERVVAAIMLRGQLDDDGEARMRAALDACALPRTRVALEAVLDAREDDERIAEQLDRVMSVSNID